jgi:hypothetical protein
VDELWISVDVITRISRLLDDADARITRDRLAYAAFAEREAKRAKREAARKAREEERARAQEERARAQEERERKASEKTAAAAEAAEAKVKDKEERDGARKPRKSNLLTNDQAHALHAVGAKSNGTALVRKDKIYDRIREVLDRLAECRDDWIDASVELAVLLCQLREEHESDKLFGQALEQRGIDIGAQDRLALVHLGANPQKMREIYRGTPRHSHRLIWKDVRRALSHG